MAILCRPFKSSGCRRACIWCIKRMRVAAGSFEERGNLEKAEELRKGYLDITERRRGSKDPATLQAMNYLAAFYVRARWFEKAEDVN